MRVFFRQVLSNHFIQAILFVLVLWFLYELRTILIILLLAFIVMSGMKPLIEKLEKRSWPRPLAILTPYFGLFAFLALVSYGVLPTVIGKLRELMDSLPQYLEQAATFLTGVPIENLATKASELIEPLLDSLLFLPGAVFVFFVAMAAILFIIIYLLWDPHYIYSKVKWLKRDGEPNVIHKVESAMGMWIRGQIIIALLVGGMTWIGLTILGLEFALTLAILAAFLEFIPYVGPIIAAGIAILVAIGDSWLMVGLVALLFFIIQQVESNILVPQVMKRSVNLHPITIIISILVGSHFLGIIGALIAVPLATIGMIAWREVRSIRKHT